MFWCDSAPAVRASRRKRSRTIGVVGEVRRQRLDRDAAVEAKVAREVDDAHAAAADLALQLVLSGERVGEPREVVGLCGRQGCRHGADAITGRLASRSRSVSRIHYIWTGRRVAPLNGSAPSLAFRSRRTLTLSETGRWRRRRCPSGPRRTTRFRSTAPTTSSSTSATPSRRRISISAAFGFQLVAYRGPETGVRDRASYLLQQGKIRFVLTTPLGPDGDDRRARAQARRRRARHRALGGRRARRVREGGRARRDAGARADACCNDDDGEVVIAAIKTYGDTIHSLVERKNYAGCSCRASDASSRTISRRRVGPQVRRPLRRQRRAGKMNEWVEFYEHVMGFKNLISFDDKDISHRVLVADVEGDVERQRADQVPDQRAGRGQEEVADRRVSRFYSGPGVQHIALATDDIVETVTALRDRGVEFLSVPTTYYAELQERVGKIDEPIDQLEELGILVDRDPDGYLLQIFTKPVQDRPTLFYEIIQRKGAKSFGKGNFKALFEAIEREQALRGNL